MPLQEEERLFIDAIRNLNYEAGQLQAEENSTSSNGNSDGSDGSADTNAVDSTGTDFIDPLNRKRTLSVASDASMLRTPAAVLQQDLLIPLSEISSRRVGVQDSPACRLDSAADAATVLASRLKHSDGTSNAQVESALSWMNAINQRPSDAPRMVTMGRADGSQSPSSGRISACNSDAESSIGAHGVPDMRPSDTHMENVETPNKKQCTADV